MKERNDFKEENSNINMVKKKEKDVTLTIFFGILLIILGGGLFFNKLKQPISTLPDFLIIIITFIGILIGVWLLGRAFKD